MTTGKAGTGSAASQPSSECCMCGDYGLSHELFKCKDCQFRSQHRYCSNLYPKAESYKVCNWCLTQRDDTAEKTRNASNSSSSSSERSEDDGDGDHMIKKLKNNNNKKKKKKKKNGSSDNLGGLKGHKGPLHLQVVMSGPIKKQKSPEGCPPAAAAASKRMASSGGAGGGVVEERLIRRTKSEEISNRGITKQVFRNKVRRYKLLDEVSSQ